MVTYPTYQPIVLRFARLLLFLCVFAGMSAGMVHGFLHGENDRCVSHCESDHGNQGNPHDHDSPDSEPHRHACCHLPSADRVNDSLSLRIGFQCVLVEIDADRALAPDEPVFELDKPPLI